MAELPKVTAVDSLQLSMRATPSAYAALAGPWFVLGALYLFVSASLGGGMKGAFVSIAVGLLWVLWLRGFQLSVYTQGVVYRDGFYRSVRVPISEVLAMRNTWVKWRLLGRELRIPRLVIDYGADHHVVVNTKPFSRKEINSAIELIQKSRLQEE